MTAIRKSLICPCLILALSCVASFPAWSGEEFYVNTMRGIGSISPKGQRAMAMGGGGRGLADGVQSLGTNPAALGAFRGAAYDIGLGYDWLDDGADDAGQVTFRVGGAVNLDRIHPVSGPNQSVGALLQTQGYSDAGGMGMKRNQTGVLMAYGLHLLDDLLGGVSVALYDGKWKSDPDPFTGAAFMDRTFTGGDFRLGAIYRWCDETTFGGTINYSTGSYKEKGGYAVGGDSGDFDRYGLGVGVAHQYSEYTLLLGDLWYEKIRTDIPRALKEHDTSWGMSAGVEQQVIPEMLALRGGLYYDHTSYSSSGATTPMVRNGSFSQGRFGITAGFGLKFQSFDIGYSLDVNSGGDVKNLLDVSAQW